MEKKSPYLVEPAGMGRCAVQENVAVSVEELLDQRGAMGGQVVKDAMELEPSVHEGGLGHQIAEELDEVRPPR